MPVVKQIAEKHKGLGVQPEHYPVVGENLLIAIKDVLGDAATDTIINAWAEAYGIIADAFISVERDMYQALDNSAGGWVGFRNFRVVKKVAESNVITSFYLEPVDGEAFISHKAGQYITVKAEIEGEPYTHLRHYSLSCEPGNEFYRISVKREEAMNGYPEGIVSNYLHDKVNVGSVLPISAPAGDFTLDSEDSRPLVLMSGGVGLTPMISMLETVIKEQPNRDVLFIHAARSEKFHAMKARVQEITQQHENVTSYTVYDKAENGVECDKVGYIEAEWLSTILPTNDAAFYFCGPQGFMRAAFQNLTQLNVAVTDIHFEVFGPAADITA